MNEISKAEIRQRLGNISQLRDLLFGEQIEEYETRIEQYNNRINQLELNFQELQDNVEKRLEQLESKLLDKISAVVTSTEDKIQYIHTNNQEKHQKLNLKLETRSKESFQSIDFLQNSLNDRHSSLKLEIAQSKAALDRDLQLLKKQIFEKLESNLAELSTTKLSHNDLAEVLFELCLKLKEPKTGLELVSEHENQIAENNHVTNNSNLMLTENN